MFDLLSEDDSADSNGFGETIEPPNGDEWDRKMKLAFEKEMLGIYVSDHPLREIAEDIRAASTSSTSDISDLRDGSIGWFAGMLVGSTPDRPRAQADGLGHARGSGRVRGRHVLPQRL